MVFVGVRELKNNLSYYLARAAGGEQVTITRRGKVIGVLHPPQQASEKKSVAELVAEGFLLWSGGKPLGSSATLRLPGKPLSQYVIEGRG